MAALQHQCVVFPEITLCYFNVLNCAEMTLCQPSAVLRSGDLNWSEGPRTPKSAENDRQNASI